MEPARPPTTSQQDAPWSSSSPPPPPQEKHPQPTQKHLLIKSPSPVHCPRNRLSQGFTPETRKRLRADAVKSTYLKPSCHRTGTTTVPYPKPECVQRYQRCAKNHQEPSQNKGAPFPHQAQCGRVPARWARTIRSLDPVRGLTPPSIPLPFHWRPGIKDRLLNGSHYALL